MTPSDYTRAPMSGSLRALDSESMAPWHPLSQQELAQKAMQLAQQLAAARASQFPRNRYDSEGFVRLGACFTP